MLSAWKRTTRVHASIGLLALLCGLIALLGPGALDAQAQNPPPQEPGVTQRVFQMPRPLSELCPIKEGQTPNVDVLKPTIDWSGDADFGGLTDNFIVHAIANLTVPTAGNYTFRLTSDDGSELFIDDGLVIDHDGLHGTTDKDGAVELTAGMHALRINFFEAGGGQVLRLSWKPPGATAFSVVPNEALSTDAGVVRVTAPGSKQCEGDTDSPGDGLPLDGVNPAYDLVNLRPAGFEPKVTGLEWMGDDLLVLTWGDDDGDPSSVTAAGEVWKLNGVKDADDPADVTPTKIAADLKEPMGIKVVDGAIYVSEKHQLSRLTDADDNGVYEGKDQIATWPFDGNFHEFAFGLLYKDGFFYLNLSVSIDLGGATTVPQGSDDRGTHLKIDKDTGAIEYVAGGLRTPHGIGWGPEDEIFVTDNQGGWLPANKLIHVQPGKFYNHYTTGPDGDPGRFDDQRPTPPTLWLPHNEIANSPSQPMLIPSGPFAGQMWVADVTYGGIQRAFLEKVEGEYQGAYFRMTQGLESGITHLLLEDDGSIIVGGLGAGGNWGQTGKLQFGLQKLVPNGTETFDIQKMELADGGFDLTYTKPLSDATVADLADKYQVRQWTYVPTSAYGGPKVADEALTVTDASVSADRKTVSLKIDGLRPNRVVYVRSPRPFESEGGEPLLSTEAWSVGAFGLLYTKQDYEAPYSLKLEWMMPGDDNSGVFVGFPDTGANTDQSSISQGEEIQIDATDNPAQTTGAIYLEQAPDIEAREAVLNPPGEWNEYEIVVRDDRIVVYLNGTKINEWMDDDPNVDLSTGRIGLQTHGAGDDVYFRNVRIKDLTVRDSTTTATADPAQVTVGHGSDVIVTVSAEGAAPTGDVQLKSGDVVLGSGALVDGKVTIPTGVFDSVGTKTLTAAYAGDETTRPSSGSVEITVVPSSVNPGGGQPGGGQPGGGQPGSRPGLAIRGKADANRRRRKAAIRVHCSQDANSCAGAVRLRVGKQTVGKGRFRVAAGATDTIRVRLNRTARELLEQRERVSATLTITYGDGHTKEVRLRLTR